MGFWRRKNNNLPEPEEIEETEEDINTAEDEEEDDFSPIRESKPVSREEFKKAASENLIEKVSEAADAEESQSESVETDAVTSENDVTESFETSEPESEPEADAEVSEADEQSDLETPDETINAESDEADTADAPPEKKPRKSFKEICAEHRTAFRSTIITLSVSAAAVIAVYIYGCCTIPAETMGRNVYIENINVSNLTYAEALEKVRKSTLLDNQNITLLCGGQTFSINGADVGLTPRIDETVSKAMNYGKTSNVLADGFRNAMQLFVRHTVVPQADVNEDFLRAKLGEFGVQVHGELVEHKLEIGDGVIICTPGHTGFNNNTDKAYEQITEAIENERFSNIYVTLESASPRTYTAEDIDAFAYANPVIAWFQYQDNNVNIIPEIPGRYLDIEETTRLVSQLYEGGETVYIPYYTSYADITAEQLQAKLFNATLASYTTNFGGSTSNRCANVKNAASRINGKIIAPNEVFSFNDTVGKRSVANGFFTATEYVNGESVEGIGGGTCQVSSTLYNAVLYSDLSIVTRTSHMFAVNYCPLGQDATVADSGVDFKFLNNTGYPIKITASTSGYSLTVSIIGTQRDDPRTVKIINSSSKTNGNTTVRSVRQVYNSAGELIRTENLSGSYYMAH